MFKVGDLVRVKSKDEIGDEIAKPCGYASGFPLQWTPSMDRTCGRVGKVKKVVFWKDCSEVLVDFGGQGWRYRDSFIDPASSFEFRVGDRVMKSHWFGSVSNRTQEVLEVQSWNTSTTVVGCGAPLGDEGPQGVYGFYRPSELDFISRPCDCVDTPTSPESQPAECVCVSPERKETFSLAMKLNYDDSDVIAYRSRQVVDGMSDIGEMIAAGIKATTLSRSSLILARAIVESCEPSMKCPNAKAVNDASDELRLQAMKVIDAWDSYDRHVSDNER